LAELYDTFPIICVVGPTASGKTGLSIKLAQYFDAEIVSCDSMQIYKHMDIGTAKPTSDEMCGISHHLIDFLNLEDDFSLAQYVALAKEKISEIASRGKKVILVGGTGLYYSSLINGIQLSPIQSDEKLREEFANYELKSIICAEPNLMAFVCFEKGPCKKVTSRSLIWKLLLRAK
jgi:tRNA dimethylallyltransferase